MVERQALRIDKLAFNELEDAMIALNEDIRWAHKVWVHLERSPQLGYREGKTGRSKPDILFRPLWQVAVDLNDVRNHAELFSGDVARAYSNGVRLDDVHDSRRRIHEQFINLTFSLRIAPLKKIIEKMPQWNFFLAHLKKLNIIIDV